MNTKFIAASTAEVKIQQLQFESDTWKRTLNFLSDENIHLKNRMTEILRNGCEHEVLEQMEIFQESFVQEDLLIGLIRSEVAAFDNTLAKESVSEIQSTDKLNMKAAALRNSIITAEQKFDELRNNFNMFVLSVH